MASNTMSTQTNKISVEYRGSKGWLIFWIFVFFPIALTLLAIGGKFQVDGKTYFVDYEGSRFWLCFWVLACFPVAFLLLILNGVSLNQQTAIEIS